MNILYFYEDICIYIIWLISKIIHEIMNVLLFSNQINLQIVFMLQNKLNAYKNVKQTQIKSTCINIKRRLINNLKTTTCEYNVHTIR